MSLYEDLVAAWVPTKHDWLRHHPLGETLINKLGKQRMFSYCACMLDDKQSLKHQKPCFSSRFLVIDCHFPLQMICSFYILELRAKFWITLVHLIQRL